MKHLFSLACRTFGVGGFLFLFHVSFSQNITLNQLKALKVRNIGPSGMSGRVTCVDVVVNNPDTWYIGSASGGVWKTVNAGATFRPVFDDQPTLNIGSIAIEQSN